MTNVIDVFNCPAQHTRQLLFRGLPARFFAQSCSRRRARGLSNLSLAFVLMRSAELCESHKREVCTSSTLQRVPEESSISAQPPKESWASSLTVLPFPSSHTHRSFPHLIVWTRQYTFCLCLPAFGPISSCLPPEQHCKHCAVCRPL